MSAQKQCRKLLLMNTWWHKINQKILANLLAIPSSWKKNIKHNMKISYRIQSEGSNNFMQTNTRTRKKKRKNNYFLKISQQLMMGSTKLNELTILFIFRKNFFVIILLLDTLFNSGDLGYLILTRVFNYLVSLLWVFFLIPKKKLRSL